jgi:hypothetical protein
MAKIQKRVMVIGLIVFVAMILYPPWTAEIRGLCLGTQGYHLFGSAPHAHYRGEDHGNICQIDFGRLGLQLIAVAVVTGAVMLLLKK